MNADLVVVWDGGHRGVDADLLCCVPRLPIDTHAEPEHWHDEPAVPIEKKHRSVALVEAERAAVLAVLASGRVVTLTEIRRQTGITGHRQLHIALRELMARNLVQRAGYARVRLSVRGRHQTAMKSA